MPNRRVPIYLSAVEDDDEASLREIVGWLNDPCVVKYSEQRHKAHSLKTQKEYLKSFRLQDVYWGVWTGNQLIGTITAYVDVHNAVANVGIMIGDKSYWGKGVGYQTWERACGHLMDIAPIRKIEVGCMDRNGAMVAICQKYGMVEEGRQNDHFIFEGGTADLIHWGKFNEAS
jgi:[ribosomal protein S5]-alanine N-acetyltransferase